MRKHHPKNERIKRQYFTYLEEAGRMNASSVDQVAAAIAQFETSTGHRDFGAFHFEQARKFKRGLTESDESASRQTSCESHNLFAAHGCEDILRLVGRAAGISVTADLFRHGLFQPVQQ
jgi:hypothetical protein